MERKSIYITIACWALIAWTATGAEVWRENSFADFHDGTFGDGGANTYVSAAGRIQTVNRWDLNGDGFIDLVFNNTHSIAEGLNLSLYWGNGADYDIRRHDYLPANGSQWTTPADLDGDGTMDLVVINYANGSSTDLDAFVYYGGEDKATTTGQALDWDFPPFHRKITLPVKAAQKAAVGDLNRDGHPDIVFAQSGGFWEYRHSKDEFESPSRIIWGSANGFDPKRFTDLPAIGACDVAIGNLNGDTWPDIVFANHGLGEKLDVDSYIYWGAGPDGFSEKRRTGLPTHQASAVEIADINGDHDVDVLFANEKGDQSFGYLSDRGQFGRDWRKIVFETHTAKDCVVSDFNRDGKSDVFFSNHAIGGNRLTDSYLYFGSPEGFAEKNRLALPTIGAWGANAADLNGDGWVDLVVSNHREHYSFEVPSFIYWNAPDGFKPLSRTCLYEHGAAGNAIADFNGDGHADLIFNSMSARERTGFDQNYVYWGDEKGRYGTQNRIELPGRETYESAAADLDDDGRADLVFANSGETGRRMNEAWIYWNQNPSFDPWRVTGLTGHYPVGVEVADLVRNGWLDLILTGYPAAGQTGTSSFIYWGETDGYIVTRRTGLNAGGGACIVADVNRDGFLDLVFGPGGNLPDQPKLASILWGDGSRDYGDARRAFIPGTESTDQPAAADLNKDGYLDLIFAASGFGVNTPIYFGSAKGVFSAERRMELKSDGLGVSINIADVDNDGWLDVVLPVYLEGAPASRTTLTPVWRGGPEGFLPERMFKLPTDSGTGSLVSDFNFDGNPDIFIFCHRREGDPNRNGAFGDHRTDSFLYWGGSQGFSEQNRLGVPGAGPHYDSGGDLGRIDDRGFDFDYVSSPYQITSGRPARIGWKAQTPGRTRVKFQLRAAASKEALEAAEWTGPNGPGSYYVNANDPIGELPKGDWMQYRAVLCTGNGALSPVLSEVEIAFK